MEQQGVLTMDESAWQAGFVSGNLRRDERCPYTATSAKAWAWVSGRIEGAAHAPGTLPKLRPIKEPEPTADDPDAVPARQGPSVRLVTVDPSKDAAASVRKSD
jgi:hypothetical protein